MDKGTGQPGSGVRPGGRGQEALSGTVPASPSNASCLMEKRSWARRAWPAPRLHPGFLEVSRADPAPTLPHNLLFLSSRCRRLHGVTQLLYVHPAARGAWW